MLTLSKEYHQLTDTFVTESQLLLFLDLLINRIFHVNKTNHPDFNSKAQMIKYNRKVRSRFQILIIND